jgi:hypothetical protein
MLGKPENFALAHQGCAAQIALTPCYRSIKINHRISVILLQSGAKRSKFTILPNKTNFYRILSDASRIERALLAPIQLAEASWNCFGQAVRGCGQSFMR